MLKWILVLLISGEALGATRSQFDKLPPSADRSKIYLQMRSSIAFIESRGDPSARNKRTSASGKYQFMKAWDKWFLRNKGRTWTSTVPSKKAPKETKLALGKIQDDLFDWYYNLLVSPWIDYIRKKRIGETYTDPELVAMIHRQGSQGAVTYLTRGRDPYAGKYGNRHVSKHIESMRKAMRFENYIDHMGR